MGPDAVDFFFGENVQQKWLVGGRNNGTGGFLFGGVEMDNFWLRLWLLLLPTGSEFEIHGKLVGLDPRNFSCVVMLCLPFWKISRWTARNLQEIQAGRSFLK